MSIPDPLPTSLTEEQQRVVLAPEGPLLVLAGAGSGKTRALTHRVAHLLLRGVPARQVLLMTFTNRAAGEMLRRVDELTGAWNGRSIGRPATGEDRIWAGTFHHIAVRLLQKHGQRLGLPSFGDFRILNQQQACDLLAQCLKEARTHPMGGMRWPGPRTMQSLLSLSVSGELTLEQVLLRRDRGLLPQLHALDRACAAYARRKIQLGLLDFDDLLLLLRLLLCDVPDVAEALREQFRHVLVDEYQDVSPLQSALCDQIATGHGNLCVVGDEAQSIYGFRGADLSCILSFDARWPGARTLHLCDNHRSSAPIVALGNRLIARDRRPGRGPMRAVRPGHAPARPVLVPLPDPAAQARFVAGRICDLLSEGRDPRDIAVLYRNHAHSRHVREELSRKAIPHVLHSGPQKDELAELMLPPGPLPAGGEPPGQQGVALSTIHKAKGLEWAVVFLIWLCDGHLPAPSRAEVSEEEERRLCYVAMTRARDQLYLCYPERSAGTVQSPSRFVRELCGGDEPIERWTVT